MHTEPNSAGAIGTPASTSAFSPLGPVPPATSAPSAAQPTAAAAATAVPSAHMASAAFRMPAVAVPKTTFDRERERDNSKAVGTPLSGTPLSSSPKNAVLIRRLPISTTHESLRLMTVFCKELSDVQLISSDKSEDSGYRSAILSFDSPDGAREAKTMLEGKKNPSSDTAFIVELVNSNSRRFASPDAVNTPTSSTASSRASNRYPFASGFAATGTSAVSRPPVDLQAEPSSAVLLQHIFSPQSPIGGHRTDFTVPSGKALINHDTTSDDDTRELLNDPLAFAENGAIGTSSVLPITSAPSAAGLSCMYPVAHNGRRATVPHTFTQQMAGLSLNTSAAAASNYNPMGHPFSAHPASNGMRSSISSGMPSSMPGNMGNGLSNGISSGVSNGIPNHLLSAGHPGSAMNGMVPHTPSPSAVLHASLQATVQAQLQQPQKYNRTSFVTPPINPSDQNPPCNTLYVGNIPMETSEEELKALFSKQRGYKRLSVRTKGNGPMCFVEFEDISFATKTLYELYGVTLRNSNKGGIRLSFSKNPLGVRTGQNPAQHPIGPAVPNMNMMNGAVPGSFSAANGPPPGLSAPPGLNVGRGGYSASASPLSNGGSSNVMGSASLGGSHALPPPGYNGSLGLGNPTWGTSPSLYYTSYDGIAGEGQNGSAASNGVHGASGYPSYMMGR